MLVSQEIWKSLRLAVYISEAGKLTGQTLMAASDTCFSTHRLFVTDRVTKISFLVDTGADFCVYPRSLLKNRR